MIYSILLFICLSCKKESSVIDAPKEFDTIPITKTLKPLLLDEASGIADSKANSGYIWVQQDSGNPNNIALLSHGGVFLKSIHILPAANRDWEDMAIGNGPVAGTNYLYLADIGDNSLSASQYFIYRFAEPSSATDTVFSCDKITFQYPDGPHDAEALFIDNATKDIYIITKQDKPSQVYKLSYPQQTSSVNTAVHIGSLSFTGVTSASLSKSGSELLIKTYSSVYHLKRNTSQTIEQLLTATPVILDYQPEPQGEAICFKEDNSGFFTLSERPAFISSVTLNFYKRK